MKTKETIRQIYSIKIASSLATIYGTGEAHTNEFKKALALINKVTKKTKKADLEYTLQTILINC